MIKKLTWAVLLRVIGYSYQPLLVPILILVLGLPGYGQLSAAMAVSAIAMAFCEYGHNATIGTRMAAYAADERDFATSMYYSVVMYQKTILLVIASSIIYLWMIWFSDGLIFDKWLLIVVIACVIAPEVITPTWYYIGTGRLTRLLAYQLIGRIVAFIAVGWLAYQKISITIASAALLCGLPFIVGSLLSNQYLWLRTKPKWNPIGLAKLVGDMGRQTPYFLGTFSASISPSVFLLLVTVRFSSDTLGQYAIAGVAWGALRQLSQLGSNLYLTDASNTLRQKASMLILRASGFGIFCSIVTVVIVQLIIYFLADKGWFSIDYNLACHYLYLLAISVIFYSINFSIGLHIFCSSRQRTKFTLTQAAPIIVLVAMTFSWPDLKPTEMAILMIASEFSGLVLALLNMRKKMPKPMYG